MNLHSTMYLLNREKQPGALRAGLFTFHYVSIKSAQWYILDISICKFTFHYVSIKSTIGRRGRARSCYLHSTMYLLNPCATSLRHSSLLSFTFHYVSIKSSNTEPGDRMMEVFTFHYVSIKSDGADHYRHYRPQFTFHYVSIKSLLGFNDL